MAFFVYDLIFLVGFSIAIAIFLYINRKNLKREMKIGFMYKAQWGVKLINYIGGKYTRTLNFLKYVIISMGYILMLGILYLIFRSVYIYVRHPVAITRIIKAPPLAPVIPYFPTLFGMRSFFPPFYFTYFLLALAIVAIVHEFSHGIFMKHYKVRIKSTGLFFLGPLLGAFVEQNDKDLNKKKKTEQMAILGAGVFANVIAGVVFYLIWIGLFYITFTPSGAVFDSYAGGMVNINSISEIGGIPISGQTNQEIIDLIDNADLSNDLVSMVNGKPTDFTKVVADDKEYFITKEMLIEQLVFDEEQVGLYYDLPAIRAQLIGTIIEIDGNEIRKYSELDAILDNYKPGDEINIKTKFKEEVFEYNLVLGENPRDPETPMIGVGNRKLKINLAESFAIFKESFTEYSTRAELLAFLYFLVFWIFLINILVAFFNMLPVSILDGGRFFYLTMWGITGSEKAGKKAYKWIGMIILFAFALMMLSWLVGIAS